MPALSKHGLSRLHDSMEIHVEAGSLPGLVTLAPLPSPVNQDFWAGVNAATATR